MKTGFIPAELYNFCTKAVGKFHREKGMDNLASRIETAPNLDVLGRLPGSIDVLNGCKRYFNIRKWCFFGSIGIVCFTFLIPWWSLSALILIFLADKIIARREKDGWISLAALLLSLDVLANDFSGWGGRYPKEKDEALLILRADPKMPGTAWLDYYSPEKTV